MKYPNMTVYECDKCGYKETIGDDSQNAAYWHEHSRIRGTGNEMTFDLCDKCETAYKAYMQDEDKAFAVFLPMKEV